MKQKITTLQALTYLFLLFGGSIAMPSSLKAEEGAPKSQQEREKTVVFAGGCFWCLQPPFDKMTGVLKTEVGYAGGADSPKPTYESVSAGGTGHLEVIRVTYDPQQVSYSQLLDVFWRNIDPLDGSGQFCDKGDQYRSAIFYQNDEEKRSAQASLEALGQLFSDPIKTDLIPSSTFFLAEEDHQDYYKKNPIRYKFYRYNCGRDQRLQSLWGDKK